MSHSDIKGPKVAVGPWHSSRLGFGSSRIRLKILEEFFLRSMQKVDYVFIKRGLDLHFFNDVCTSPAEKSNFGYLGGFLGTDLETFLFFVNGGIENLCNVNREK